MNPSERKNDISKYRKSEACWKRVDRLMKKIKRRGGGFFITTINERSQRRFSRHMRQSEKIDNKLSKKYNCGTGCIKEALGL